ncbi:MFS transporter [Bacillus massiliigorillae]|uniref:MFS transporter n=1 Tax=Bacillus massiliigorillae TaxID=1243664 RepID=UPI0003A3D02C|nr:MFS transporter [Bacillus massiliigorillae]
MESLNNKSRSYEFRIVTFMFLAWGFVFLDRTALSYIMPVLVDSLDLTNGQVGQINMWQTIGYAIAGPLVGMYSDRTGKRKPLLIAAILSTAIFSAISALATSYPLLLAVRFLVGASEGPILPLAVSMVASASLAGRFGRNVGIVNAGVAVISGTLGPTLVTQLVSFTNWHMAFVIVSIPSIILAILIWRFTEEVPSAPVVEQQSQPEKKNGIFEALKYRNIVMCILINISMMTGFWILAAFAPLYLTSVGNYSIEKMGLIMSLMGIVTIITSILVPLFSDYFGRKSALMIFALLAGLAPLGLYLFPTSIGGSASLILCGGLFGAIAPIYMSIIPEETMPVHLRATSSALIIGIGEIMGSFILGGSGTLADSYGLPFVMIVAAISGLVITLLSIGLIETNPRKKQKGSSVELDQNEIVS